MDNLEFPKWVLTPYSPEGEVLELTTTLNASKATITQLQAEITTLKSQLSAASAEALRLTGLVTEADRKQKLCICGSPSGIVSPTVATELSKGKIVTVAHPTTGAQVEILFAV